MTSTLDPDNLADNGKPVVKGHDIRSLGPSDSSDTGADLAGAPIEDDMVSGADTDRFGTGERATALDEDNVEPNADIAPDRIVTAEEAGLGGGLDQAEEARYGVKDEELESNVDEDATLPPGSRRRGREH